MLGGQKAGKSFRSFLCGTLAGILSGMLFYAGSVNVYAQEFEKQKEQQEQKAPIGISTAEEFNAMREHPEESYILTADIDMDGMEWIPFSFQGELDGGGYSVLNLKISQCGDSVRQTYDGNMKVYDTYFAALFDVAENASIRNLNLLNLRIEVETDLPCFVGGFAGYLADSSVENCSIRGILQLKAHDRMFGVGGVIGYGKGSINSTNADVTLVCIDTDASTRDEQFMGGICAAGYPDINDCTVKIAGFDSDHGYVHDGGLVGMYMFYPAKTKYQGSITGNRVTGTITFFEDNTNRRAYCKGLVGEIMNWDFKNAHNDVGEFVRDERKEYDKDLLPHDCGAPKLSETVTQPGCDFGFTTYVCETCGYMETDHYTLKAHTWEWTETKPATIEEEGLKNGVCVLCGAQTQEVIEKLTPPEPESSQPEISLVDLSSYSEENDGSFFESTTVREPIFSGRERKFIILLLIAACLFSIVAVIIKGIRK